MTEEARGIAKIVAERRGKKKKEGVGRTRSTCSVSFLRRYCPPDVEIVIRYSILVARRVCVCVRCSRGDFSAERFAEKKGNGGRGLETRGGGTR